MSVNLFNYTTLSTYAVLSYSGITAVNQVTISNGYYGSAPTAAYDPTVLGTEDTIHAGQGQIDLTALVLAINSYRSGLTSQSLTSPITSTITFYPGINYNGTGITFQGINIILDAQGNSNAQFFITSTSAFTFDNIPSITLINGARNCNIFWLAGTAITFTGTSPPSIPGIFIAGSAITFANPSQILGRLYAQTENVEFNGATGNYTVNATCTPIPVISDICFPGDTPIETDQGIMCIKDVDATKHTIGNEKIIAITQTISLDEYLVCFEKDALGENCPDKQTLISKSHKIEYKGRMVEAYKFMASFENVYPVKYNGETLYNVLMEYYRTVQINQLSCETLHPSNITAQMYILQRFDKLAEVNLGIYNHHKKHDLNKKMRKMVLASIF